MKINVKVLFKTVLFIGVLVVITVVASNLYIIKSTEKDIFTMEDLPADDYDCIMVLGAGAWGNRPSPILRDRLAMGEALYRSGAAKKLLLSGDHQRKNYNEVGVMNDYMVEQGITLSDIFLDHAGLSTYQSMMRAKHVFGVHKMIVVTQKFHMQRALYLANCAGIAAVGVAAEDIAYPSASYRESREILARSKDYFNGLLKLESYIGGDPIDIAGDGRQTQD